MRKDTRAVDGGSVTLGREGNEDPGPRGKWEQPLHMERLEDAEKDLHFVNGINGIWGSSPVCSCQALAAAFTQVKGPLSAQRKTRFPSSHKGVVCRDGHQPQERLSRQESWEGAV